MTRRILAADDMEFNRHHLRKLLETDGYEVETVPDGRSAWLELGAHKYHLVITDLRMPDLSGLDLLAKIRAARLPVGVILFTAFGDPEEALRAMKAGADDFITKPCDPDRLRLVVKRILERRQLIDELEQLRTHSADHQHFHTMISKSPKMKRVFGLVEQVGPIGSTVLVEGETGTGKELVARAIHAASPRRSGPLVALNCALLNESLLESELFGHEKGAFTGAERRKLGRFELASGGTILLDEIGDMPLALQSKLLRVLQSGTFERVGGIETLTTDVRVVAATNKTLQEEVKRGRFRADLFYRLNVIRIELPPLRERTEDIPLLAMHFLDKHNRTSGTPVTEIHFEAMQALLSHSWPGNIRELENAIKAGVALADGSILRKDDLPATVAPPGPSLAAGSALIDIDRPLPELTNDLISQIEREYFVRLLEQCRGNVARCARQSGLSRRSVSQKLHKFGLERARFKVASRPGYGATSLLDDELSSDDFSGE
jgi:DNA-binding NtrC family response regulator